MNLDAQLFLLILVGIVAVAAIFTDQRREYLDRRARQLSGDYS